MKSNPSSNFLIKMLPDKQAFFCAPDQTVLEAGLSAGLPLPHSCRGGNCGSCLATVLAGTFAYKSEVTPLGITPEQKQQGQALLCQIQPRSTLTLKTQTAKSTDQIQVLRLPCRIISRELVANDVVKLKIQLPRSQPLHFRVGQHVNFIFDKGRQRSYSMANLPIQGEPLELHVRRVDNGLFSNIAFDFTAGSTLMRLEGPHGHFGLTENDHTIVMIAGGTGYAPIKAMLHALWQRPNHPPVHLFWGGRDCQDLYELKFLQQKALEDERFFFTPVVEKHQAHQPTLSVGFVHNIALTQNFDFATVDIYAAGPPMMIAALRADAEQLGIPDGHLFCDVFDHAQK